ncbi:DMT family transporter [Lentzea sp. NPDC059081]|uniref:EamA family transporter n=1 Tax=Lentzea sp. NPDC059081 TaxID=3346719 RepID=UPI0036BD6EB6
MVEPRFRDRGSAAVQRMPPHAYFVVSAVFHYLGPALAVLLFARVEVLGVAWLRIATAALVFAVWRRPWRLWQHLDRPTRWLLTGWAAVLAVMNSMFYLAIDRLPLGTVAAIEFLPVIVLAALAARTRRNVAALVAAVVGVYLLTDVRLVAEPWASRSPSPTRCCSPSTSSSGTAWPAAGRCPASTAWLCR